MESGATTNRQVSFSAILKTMDSVVSFTVVKRDLNYTQMASNRSCFHHHFCFLAKLIDRLGFEAY